MPWAATVWMLAAALSAACSPPREPDASPERATLQAGRVEEPESEWLVDVTGELGVDFVHVHGGSGERYMVETMAAGGGFCDFDNDGWLDLYLVQSGPLPGYPDSAPLANRLYLNRGPLTSADGSTTGGAFEDVTATVGGGDEGYGMGVCFADVDNDGFTDVYVTNFGRDRLYLNDRGRRLVDATAASGIDNPRWGTSCAFADADRDGCLDLYVVNYVDYELDRHRRCHEGELHVYCHPDVYDGVPDLLYRNRCGAQAGVFDDVTEEAGVLVDDPGESKGLGVVWTDFDDDGDADLYVTNDSTRNFLYRNEGSTAHGGIVFRDVGTLSGSAFNDQGLTEAGMGTDAGDVDGDGLFDLFVANLDFETNTLYRNQDGRMFFDATAAARLAAPSATFVGFGVNLFDLDNDGDLDLFVANGHILDNVREQNPSLSYGQRDGLFLNSGAGRFEPAPGKAGSHFGRALVGRGSAVGDVDNDGDLDLLITHCNQPAVLLRNRVGDRSNGLLLRLESRYGGRDAIGAKVTVVTARRSMVEEIRSGSSYLSQGDLRLHFGLGSETAVERLEIRWPEGALQQVDGSEVRINTVNRIRQESP